MNSLLQALGRQEHTIVVLVRPVDRGRAGLGDTASQLNPSRLHAPAYPLRQYATHLVPPGKLESLKLERFTAEGRMERMQRSLAALNQPETLQLTPHEWRFFAEDPDLDDQD